MSLRPAPPSPFDRDGGRARARSAISLGAAFALFCTVLFGVDMPASEASGGLIEALFGLSERPGRLYYNAPAPHGRATRSYQGARRVRHAKSQRAHYAQARRQITERRKFALNRRATPVEPRRAGAVEPVALTQNPFFRISKPVLKASPSTSESAGGAGPRALCVRACDGYSFPAPSVSRGAGVDARRASCEKLCPGAETNLFVLPAGSDNVEEAKAAGSGETYAALLARLGLKDERAKSCSCQTEASAKAATNALLSDATLRPGDTVVTAQGLRVVRRGSRYPFKATDFLSLAETRDTPLSVRSALYAIERALKTPQGRLAAAANGERRRPGRKDEAAVNH